MLSWTSQNATLLELDRGIGAVTPVAAGSLTVSPTITTTYTATATGPGGSSNCTATVQVVASQGSQAIWRSYDVLPQNRTVTDTAGQETTAVEFYESTNDGGVNKGALLPVYTPGTHPSSSNAVSSYWSTTSGSSAYPYVGIRYRLDEGLAAEKQMLSRR